MLNQLGMNQKQESPILKNYYNPIPFPAVQAQLLQNKLKHYLCPTFLVLRLNAMVYARIERIDIPPDKLEELNDLAINRLSPSAKRNLINRATIFCCVCHSIPEYFMIYSCDGAQKVEQYCSDCLEKEMVKKY